MRWAVGVVYSVFVFLFSVSVWSPFKRRTRRCSEHKIKKILDTVKTIPIVHKGGIPENTIDGIKRSKDKGASAIEVDLQFTKDGHPVLLHDDTVDRTSNSTGTISTMTLEEVKTLDVGIKFGYPGCKIPTLSEMMVIIKQLDMILFLEIKSLNKKYLGRLLEIFEEDSSLYERVLIISFYPDLLHEIRKRDPNILIGFITYGPMLSAETYSSKRSNRLNVFEYVFLTFITRYIPKLLGTNLLIMYKEDIFNERINFKGIRERGNEIILYEVNSNMEVKRCKTDYNSPFIISENFFLT